MKGSTLHRSGLTRERMNVLANLSQTDRKPNTRAQLNQYYKTAKSQELDLLWGSVQKGIQKVHNVGKQTQQRSPITYLTIGFIAGVLFMSCITLFVSVLSMTPKTNSSVAVIGEEGISEPVAEPLITQEKYVVKKGDTLNGIAYRFYGKYDEAKIMEIQNVNNILNPAALRIGQELVIPVSR